MVPVHAITSWVSLRFITAHVWLSPLRDCYEAFVIYSFFMYLLGCLEDLVPGGEVLLCLSRLGDVHHLYPFSKFPMWFPPIPGGAEYLKWTKRRVMLYVVVRPLLVRQATGPMLTASNA